MFGTVLTVIYSAMLAYVLWRAFRVPRLAKWLRPKRFLILGALLWLVFFLGRFVGHGGTGRLMAALELVGMTLLGWVFLVFLPLLAVDLLTGFGRLLPRWASALRGGALVVGTALALVALVQGLRAPELEAYEVTLPGLPPELDGTVVVAISDAHLGSQLGEDWFAARIEQIAELDPDVVVFLGDIFEGHGAPPSELPGLSELSPRLGKFYVLGNHEYMREGESGPVQLLDRSGFVRLGNGWRELAPGLILVGVDDLTQQRRRAPDADALGEALVGLPNAASVLLSHSPLEAERAAKAGIGLMLSGHTHDGQLWPLGILVQQVYPLVSGRYDVDGMAVIVSRGLGTWGPRMRLWRRGELVAVTLRAPR